jgi:hypothetical protein
MLLRTVLGIVLVGEMHWKSTYGLHENRFVIRGPFEKFVEWRQYAAVVQGEAVTVMPSCSGVG